MDGWIGLFIGCHIATSEEFWLGPEGCGKTLLAMAIAGEKKYPVVATSVSELFRAFSSDKDDVKKLFAQAKNTASFLL